MKTYKYTDATNKVVHVIDEDGISRISGLLSIVPEGETILPADPVPTPIAIVTPRQARLALKSAGLLTAVTDWIATADQETQIDWEFATEIRRDWPPIAACATELGLTDAQLDDLFTLAGTL